MIPILLVLAVTTVPCTARVFPADGRCFPSGNVRHYVAEVLASTLFSVWRNDTLVCRGVQSSRFGTLVFRTGGVGRYCVCPADSAGLCP